MMPARPLLTFTVASKSLVTYENVDGLCLLTTPSYRIVYRDIKPENLGFDVRGE